MAQITFAQFDGGISSNSKTGFKDACKISRNLDIYSDSDSVSLNPIPIKVSGSTVVDTVLWVVDGTPFDTNRYFYGDGGNLYKETSGGTWSVLRSGATIGNGSTGQGLIVLADYLYYPTNTTVGRYGPLSGTPTFNDDFFTDAIIDLDQSANTSSTTNTYTPPVNISESATAKMAITPTRDPIRRCDVYLKTTGTGNWTLTIHDLNNTAIGSATVANASLVAANNYQPFTFATPLRYPLGSTATWHFHITSTVADGTVAVATSADFSTANYKEYMGSLIADTYHPMIQHTNGITGIWVIGNFNYFGSWNGATYNPNKIALAPGYKVRSFTRDNEFVVGLAWRGTNIDSYEDGIAYYWDGIQPYYNYAKPIMGGSPNSAVNFKNRILSVLGSSGELHLYTEPFKKIQPAPQLVKGKKIEVLPGAMTIWQGRAQIGIGANTDDSVGLEQGVYEFGNQSDRKITYQDVSTEVLNYGYQISTGTTQSTTMKIGCVAAFGKDMYISWKDASTYGVDKVSKGNNPAATGSWESLINDQSADTNGQLYSAPQKTKLAQKLVITFISLPTGCTVTPKYRLDRAASFTLGTAVTSTSSVTTIAELPINTRYKEVEFGWNQVATVNYPKITGLYFLFDPLIGERQEN